MNTYLNRINDLSVDIKNLKYSEFKPNHKDILSHVNKLIENYKDSKIYEMYGEKTIQYICLLSVRYAMWNMGELSNNNEAVEILSL